MENDKQPLSQSTAYNHTATLLEVSQRSLANALASHPANLYQGRRRVREDDSNNFGISPVRSTTTDSKLARAIKQKQYDLRSANDAASIGGDSPRLRVSDLSYSPHHTPKTRQTETEMNSVSPATPITNLSKTISTSILTPTANNLNSLSSSSKRNVLSSAWSENGAVLANHSLRSDVVNFLQYSNPRLGASAGHSMLSKTNSGYLSDDSTLRMRRSSSSSSLAQRQELREITKRVVKEELIALHSPDLTKCTTILFKEFDILYKIFQFYAMLPMLHVNTELSPRCPMVSIKHTKTLLLQFPQLLKLARDYTLVPQMISKEDLYDYFQDVTSLVATNNGDKNNILDGRDQSGITISKFLILLANIALREASISDPAARGLGFLQYLNRSNGLMYINDERASELCCFGLKWINQVLS